MSIDFIALFDVTVDGVSLEWLLPRLAEQEAIFRPFVERYGQFFRPKAWAIERVYHGPERDALVGPGSFIISMGEASTLKLWHGIRFDEFSGNAWHRGVLRNICSLVAKLVGSERAIYTHECMPYDEAGGLVGVEAQLRKVIGPPARTFEELHKASDFGPRRWYIDTFPDSP